MPLLFSYGTLQRPDIQLSTFGRLLSGERDELIGYVAALVRIDDPEMAARLGKSHHDDVTFNGDENCRVAGMAFEITDAELTSVDAYEARFAYERVMARLASGRETWLYVHVPR